jgi:hypothetical protein
MDPDKVLETEFSESFVKGMKDRMIVSYFKYGPVKNAYPDKVNAMDSLQQRLKKYNETGNTEFLIDAANFAMIEFMYPSHPEAFFKGTDSNESPGRTDQEGYVTFKSNTNIGKSDSEVAKEAFYNRLGI